MRNPFFSRASSTHHPVCSVLPALLAAILLAGCASRNFTLQVNALADPAASASLTGQRYVLLPGDPNLRPNELQFREFKALAQNALARKGYHAVENEADADFAVFMNYGVSAPQTTAYNYSVPIYGTFGGGYSTYTETRPGPTGHPRTYRGTVYNQPAWGVVGTDTRTAYETRFTQYLRLDAVRTNDVPTPSQHAPGHPPTTTVPAIVLPPSPIASQNPQTPPAPQDDLQPLWSVTVTTTRADNDLRNTFPYLLSAALPHLATNPGRQLTTTLPPNDPTAESLRH